MLDVRCTILQYQSDSSYYLPGVHRTPYIVHCQICNLKSG